MVRPLISRRADASITNLDQRLRTCSWMVAFVSSGKPTTVTVWRNRVAQKLAVLTEKMPE